MGRPKKAGREAGKSFVERFDGDRFETILNSISDGVFAVDLEFRLTCFNLAAEKTIGVKREDALGRRCSDVLNSSVCKDGCAMRYTIKTGKSIVNLPTHVRDVEGRSVPVTISTSLVRNRQGKIIGGVETFRNLNVVKGLLEEVGDSLEIRKIVTMDARVKKLLEMVPMIAESESTVLISGESGTGKGLLARAIHAASSRRDKPMVTINCGALPETLLESELFGYKAGAFTDAKRDKPGRVDVAEGSTLFLDEIGDLPLSLQVKILRLLQERRYEPLGGVESVTADVRIVAATNRHLLEMVEKGTFREDLYYRVNVIPLVMPPLREHKSDIPLLADAFLRRLSMVRGKSIDGISRGALGRLMRYDYPGNVRELENILEHAYVLCAGSHIGERDLPEWFEEKQRGTSQAGGGSLKELEASYFREVLARNRWNRTLAARELGIHVTTLYRKVRRLGIELPAEDGRSARSKAARPAPRGDCGEQ